MTSTRRRVAVAAIALGAYAACGDAPAEPQHTAHGDLPKMDYPQPASIDDASDYVLPQSTRPTRVRVARSQRAPRTPRAEAQGRELRVVTSTAYCLTGTMANGQRVYRGAVAMNGVPLGSRWEVVGTGHVYTVADRIGHSSQFDIAMPGDCAAARAYGRRTITVRRVG